MPKEEKLEKMFTIPAAFRNVSNHGSGVPTRTFKTILDDKPPEFEPMMLLNHTEPRNGPWDIVKGLFGHDTALENSWAHYLKKEFAVTTNELDLRKALYAKMQQDRLEPELRKALFQRTMVFYRDMKKSRVQVVTPDELLKADRGGSYHRKVKTEKGGTRYYYDEEKYKSSKHSQVSGPDARKAYLSGKVCSMVEKAGKGGCGIEHMKSLAKKYGSKEVGTALRESCKSGSMCFKKGKFYARRA
jgi:hypothetical protein